MEHNWTGILILAIGGTVFGVVMWAVAVREKYYRDYMRRKRGRERK